MISIQPIRTTDAQLYAFVEELLTTAFPPEEYRELEKQREYTDRMAHFHPHIIFDDHTPIGLITYWDFGYFYYFEHFAINPALRNGGYGQKVLNHLCNELHLPIVLEVEAPVEEMAQRRINFYKRHGFHLWEKAYLQPPYRTGDNFLPMHLMVHGNLACEKDFEEVKNLIYKEVYGVKVD